MNEILRDELIKKQKQAETANPNPQVSDKILRYHKRLNTETGQMELVWEDDESKEQPQNNDDNMEKVLEMQEREQEAMVADELSFKKIKEGSAKEKRKQLVNQEKALLSNAERHRYEFLKKTKTEKR
jgi:hypothetical protein